MPQLQVEFVSADRKIWSGPAVRVIVRTVDGEMGVLPGHSPILALMAAGPVRIRPADKDAETVEVQVDGGFLSVEHDRVTLVSDSATVLSGTSVA
ncbi:MAG: F-type H+-transporting ATPase subunit epsilon [Actinomycetota bacterium]|nr:F-type H+-transporting ATPase subunit epsilon [Actinomycetota bacterium]